MAENGGVRGRKTKLTPEMQERIYTFIRAGNYIITACQACGIGQKTYENWMNRGAKESEGIYHDFYEAIKKAEAEAELESINRIRKAAAGGSPIKRTITTRVAEDGSTITTTTEVLSEPIWQADAWLRERKNPDRWGRKDRMEHKLKGEGDLPPLLKIVIENGNNGKEA